MDERTRVFGTRRTGREAAMPRKLGPLDVVRRIGTGSAGQVYEARDAATGARYVVKALKRLGPVDLKRFKLEAELMMKLHHPNVMPVLRVETQADPPFFVMPLHDGQNLFERIRAAPVSMGFVLGLGRDVAGGLAQAHAFGVVHRDVKPANVFLESANGRALLLDFGLAKVPSSAEQITNKGAILGTPAYMSPEQCTGEPVLDRSDVYSLGVCLVEMLLGVNPFRTPSLLHTVTLHVEATPRRLDALLPHRVPQELGELVARMIAKAPQHRPRAGSVFEQLSSLARDRRIASDEQTWTVADTDGALARIFYDRAV